MWGTQKKACAPSRLHHLQHVQINLDSSDVASCAHTLSPDSFVFVVSIPPVLPRSPCLPERPLTPQSVSKVDVFGWLLKLVVRRPFSLVIADSGCS